MRELPINSGDLCDFFRRWKSDGDYLRCVECKRPQLASYAYLEFPHAAGCKAEGRGEKHPWATLASLIAPAGGLHRAVENAAAELPEGYLISLYVERGSGWIDLTDDNGDVVRVETDDRSLAEQINEAVKAAKAVAA